MKIVNEKGRGREGNDQEGRKVMERNEEKERGK